MSAIARGRSWCIWERGRVDTQLPVLTALCMTDAAIVSHLTQRATTEVSRKLTIPVEVIGVCMLGDKQGRRRFRVYYNERPPFGWMIEIDKALLGVRPGALRSNVRAWLRQNAQQPTQLGWRWLDTDRLTLDNWLTPRRANVLWFEDQGDAAMFRLWWC